MCTETKDFVVYIYILLDFQGARITHLLFQLWTCSLCKHWKTKKNNFADFINKILIIYKPSLASREIPQKMWARSVQPFWRLLDTNKQTDKFNLYIDWLIDWFIDWLIGWLKNEWTEWMILYIYLLIDPTSTYMRWAYL